MKPELIIFDCDGTLVDSEEINNQATADILAAAGYPQYDLEFSLREFVGKDMNFVRQYVEEKENTKLPASFVPDYVDLVLKRIKEDLQPLPGAKQAIEELAASYKVCVASNGERENVLTAIETIGAVNYFGEDKTFTKDQVARGKPAPDLFLYAAEKMGVSPEKCVVVEDSVVGATAGLAAGMVTIGIIGVNPHPEQIRAEMQKAGVVHILNTWPEITNLIKTL